MTITICTARPGIIIGKQGADVEALKQELIKLTNKDVQINIHVQGILRRILVWHQDHLFHVRIIQIILHLLRRHFHCEADNAALFRPSSRCI